MVRETLMQAKDHDPDFRWRGENVSRLENLSDIAFALALSMLVASGGTPETFSDLSRFLISIVPVAAAFSVLLGIWHTHYTFFRRFGLNDRTIITYNAILIFIVLYMAYPLRFAFDSFFGFILMQFGYNDLIIKLEVDFFDSGVIIGYFAAFYAATHFILALMYGHALKQAENFELNANELALARQEKIIRLGLGVLALTVATIAYLTPLNGLAGIMLFATFVPYMIANRMHPLHKSS